MAFWSFFRVQPLENGRFEIMTGGKLASNGFEVLGSVGEHERVPSSPLCGGNVNADLSGPIFVGG
jgi:hypothetical protein